MKYLTKTNVVLAICLAVFVFVVAAKAVVKQYAFSPRYIRQTEAFLAEDWPDVSCVGKAKVTMRSGDVGYRFMQCTAELGNPATTWWFWITSNGRVHSRAKFL